MPAFPSLIETQDGSHSLFSETFGVSYHSKYGAIQESQHVFIQAGLGQVLPTRQEIRILEMGFGTGLNAYLTLLVGQSSKKKIYYETVESIPLTLEQVAQLNYPTLLGGSPADFLALHHSPWNEVVAIGNDFQLLKWDATIQEAPLGGQFDLVFYDAFAPSSQPELWEAPVLGKIFAAMASGGVFVTYCAKGVVKRCLRDLGFTVEGVPGPPGKREMIRASKP
jgi:tRNA U34 5-methylaminomethyl-2-thiouridine-forming methyltransferase MnmC